MITIFAPNSETPPTRTPNASAASSPNPPLIPAPPTATGPDSPLDQAGKERLVMAHRFLARVWATPLLSLADYKALEDGALVMAAPDSPLRKLPSGRMDDYSMEVRRLASSLFSFHQDRNRALVRKQEAYRHWG